MEDADSLSELEKKADEELKQREREAWKIKKCHEKLDYYMRRHTVEYVIIFLIIADALIVVASLLVEIRIQQEKQTDETATLISAAEPSNEHSNTTSHEGGEALEHVAEALHYTSLVILTFFMIEVFLKLFAQREKFFKRKLQIVDSFIVAISFAFDIAEIVIKESNAPEILSGLSLLIILRLWRLIRIVNSAVVATKDKLNEKIHELKRHLRVAHKANRDTMMKLDQREEEIQFLKSRLAKYEPVDMIPNGSTRLPAYLPETNTFPAEVLGDLADGNEYNMTDMRISLGNHGHTSAFHSREVDIPSDSDVMSLPPAKSRSGNTFTVKKDGVPMTSL